MDVMLLFVSQTSTFDYPNSLYLKICGCIQYEFRCFGDKIRSVFHKQKVWFSSILKFIKKILRQILRYITPGSTDHTTMFIRKVIFYCCQYIYRHRLLKEHRIWVWIRVAYTFSVLIYLRNIRVHSVWSILSVYWLSFTGWHSPGLLYWI